MPTVAVSFNASADINGCQLDQRSSVATVINVVDGDTVQLKDGRKVRIIGINTLELTAENHADRYWAEIAKTTVQELVNRERVRLIAGIDRHDRHGRLLAHIRTFDGTDIASTLLRQGLAVAVAIGANTRCAQSHSGIESIARARHTGIWKSPGDWLLESRLLTGKERGFYVIRSQIKTIAGQGKHTRLILNNGLLVKLNQLKKSDSETLLTDIQDRHGKMIEVRGWLGGRSGKAELTLYHSSSLSLHVN